MAYKEKFSKRIGIICLLPFFLFPSLSFSHDHSRLDTDIATALRLFEKAFLVSEFSAQPESQAIPFFKINGEKIYLNDGFWELTRFWLRLFIQDIQDTCPCDLDPDLIIQEARDQIPQGGFFAQKGKKIGREWALKWAVLASQYGRTAGGLLLSLEVAETLLSFAVGGWGLHVLCKINTVFVIASVRTIQKYIRVFSYGGDLSASRLFFAVKMAWLSRRVSKSKNRVFFHIEQALSFREEELKRVNQEGPKSLFHPAGHRLIWIERLKRKTDPLFEEIADWEQELQDQNLQARERRRLEKQIKSARDKIERISHLNRKDFFGARFKRYLLLKSRKGRRAYMSGSLGREQILKKTATLWPLSLQENVLEPILRPALGVGGNSTEAIPPGIGSVFEDIENSTSPADENLVLSHASGEKENLEKVVYDQEQKDSVLEDREIPPPRVDEIREGLIEEFLSQRSLNDLAEGGGRKALELYLESIERIFDTQQTSSRRLMSAKAVEDALAILFGHYLQISSSVLSQKYEMSFPQILRLHWHFGKFFYLSKEFSDFLSSVAGVKDQAKIQFYKYEAMEKLLAFFDYLHEIRVLLKDGETNVSSLFERMAERQNKLASLSLLREKRTAFSIVPFKKAVPRCVKLGERAQ